MEFMPNEASMIYLEPIKLITRAVYSRIARIERNRKERSFRAIEHLASSIIASPRRVVGQKILNQDIRTILTLRSIFSAFHSIEKLVDIGPIIKSELDVSSARFTPDITGVGF